MIQQTREQQDITVERITIEPHGNADRLEIAKVGDFNCIVGKGEFETGQLAAYIPEGSVLPEDVIQELGLEGKLSGGKKNRVKAVKLRGVLSQGLVYPLIGDRLKKHTWFQPGQDITEMMGIEKYVAPIPKKMQGYVNHDPAIQFSYNIENIKKYPRTIEEGEQINISEKIHGTWCRLGWHPKVGPVVSSKGISSRGLFFKWGEPKNEDNIYMRAYKRRWEGLKMFEEEHSIRELEIPYYILGEIYGTNIQDLGYGVPSDTFEFRVFDVWLDGKWRNDLLWYQLPSFGFQLVPQLYEGPASREIIEEHTNGPSTIYPGHIREGVVVRPIANRRTGSGRVIFKSISPDYLLRKGGTEHN